MAEHEEPEKIWDEYDWERFLQQQDRKTERYMDLLEKYLDDPNRDQIIAREMGWYHLLGEDGRDWMENVESTFPEECEECEECGEQEAGECETVIEDFEMHPLYQAAFGLTMWLDELFEELGDLENHPSAIQLAAQSAVASAKLAAALSEDDADEIGMTIAYLKRALKAIPTAMEAAAEMEKTIKFRPDQHAALHERLFQVRDGIIQSMGEYRLEWRRRFGSR